MLCHIHELPHAILQFVVFFILELTNKEDLKGALSVRPRGTLLVLQM